MADSKSLLGGIVVAIISASWSLRQSSLDRMSAPEESRNSSVGLAREPGKGSDGPMARTITLLGCVPVTMNPPIRALSPVSTRNRVEIFPNVLGVTVGVELGVGVGVGVGVAGGGVGVGGGGVGVIPGVPLGGGVGVPKDNW